MSKNKFVWDSSEIEITPGEKQAVDPKVIKKPGEVPTPKKSDKFSWSKDDVEITPAKK